jgi:hypothetical protein
MLIILLNMTASNLLLAIITLQMTMSLSTTYCSPMFVVGLLNYTHLQYEREYLKAYMARAG